MNIEKLNDYHSRIIEFLESGNYEDAAMNVRRFLELLINEKFSRFYPNINSRDINLNDKMKYLCQNGVISQKYRNMVFQIKEIGNLGGHPDLDRLNALNYETISRALIYIDCIIANNYKMCEYQEPIASNTTPDKANNTAPQSSSPDQKSTRLKNYQRYFYLLFKTKPSMLLSLNDFVFTLLCLFGAYYYSYYFMEYSIKKTINQIGQCNQGQFYREFFLFCVFLSIVQTKIYFRICTSIHDYINMILIAAVKIPFIFIGTRLISYVVTSIIYAFAGILTAKGITYYFGYWGHFKNALYVWYDIEIALFVLTAILSMFTSFINILKRLFHNKSIRSR